MNIKNVFHFIHTFLFFLCSSKFIPMRRHAGAFFVKSLCCMFSSPGHPSSGCSLSQSPDSEPAGCFTGSQSLLAWEVSMAHAGPRDSEG